MKKKEAATAEAGAEETIQTTTTTNLPAATATEIRTFCLSACYRSDGTRVEDVKETAEVEIFKEDAVISSRRQENISYTKLIKEGQEPD
jgi:hypothetical protein